MADARLLHKKSSQGERVIALPHLAFRVWVQYVLSADDYGVMRASQSVLRADNPRLEKESTRALEAAMATVLASGLVETFTHQGSTYWWQTDWNDFQQVRYPRDSSMPAPSDELLAKATPATQELFSRKVKPSRERLRKVSETAPEPVRAGGRETLTPTLTPTLPGSGSLGESTREPEVLEASSDGVPPAWGHKRHTQSLSSGLDYHRRNCPAWAGPACEAGFCIPKYLWQKWEKRQTVEALTAFVAHVMAVTPNGAGDAEEKFWPRHFEAYFGATAPEPTRQGKGARNSDVFDAAYAAMGKTRG